MEKFQLMVGAVYLLYIDYDGRPINRIFGESNPNLDKYFAYGIRNGFGLAFDPVTGNLWDTENGPSFGDEINLVEPGFNSGWGKVQGFWDATTKNSLKETKDPEGLTNFPNSKYSYPELTWIEPIGISSLKFLNTDTYGKEYTNDIFVGSANYNGNLYHFDLTEDRKDLDLKDNIADKIVDNSSEISDLIFGKNFGVISDITIGPDGYMYIVSLTKGKILKIFNDNTN